MYYTHISDIDECEDKNGGCDMFCISGHFILFGNIAYLLDNITYNFAYSLNNSMYLLEDIDFAYSLEDITYS